MTDYNIPYNLVTELIPEVVYEPMAITYLVNNDNLIIQFSGSAQEQN